MSEIKDTLQSNLSASQIDARITFHDDDEIMEIDFSNLHLDTQKQVNAFYDRVEEKIEQSGQEQWLFLINYSGCRIDPDAWFAHARRGKTLNLSHSMGTVRFDVSDITRRQIELAAGTDAFDPNLFSDHEGAINRLKSRRSKRVRKIEHAPNYSENEIASRIQFQTDEEIMTVDFSDFTFFHSRDVDDVYDHIEQRVKETNQKWYFLVNYNGCQIMPQAWIQYARRGKALNIAASLGSVRYATGSETEEEIRQRAQSQEFRPNIRNTRTEAITRIDEMKATAQSGS